MTGLRVLMAFLISVVFAAGCATMGSAGGSRSVKTVPDIKVRLVSGEEVSLSQFKGKPIVLSFGASWCPHCIHELPALKDANEKYKDDIIILMVLSKSPDKDVEAMVTKHGLKFRVGIDPEGSAEKAFGVTGIPMSFFIDSQGNIIDDYFGSLEPSTLEDKIAVLLHKTL